MVADSGTTTTPTRPSTPNDDDDEPSSPVISDRSTVRTVHPDHPGFTQHMRDLLHAAATDSAAQGDPGSAGTVLLPHQRLCQKVLNDDTPQRGLLLFHGLGTGKTCTSVAIAQGMMATRPVVVMLPRSLRRPYLEDVLRCGPDMVDDAVGDDAQGGDGSSSQRASTPPRLTFVHYNGLQHRTFKLTSADMEGKTVVIDEVHNFVSGAMNEGSVLRRVYEVLIHTVDLKLVAMSGTPLVNHPCELAWMVDLVRGRPMVLRFNVDSESAEDDARVETLLRGSPFVSTVEWRSPSVVNAILVPPRWRRAALVGTSDEGGVVEEGGRLYDDHALVRHDGTGTTTATPPRAATTWVDDVISDVGRRIAPMLSSAGSTSAPSPPRPYHVPCMPLEPDAFEAVFGGTPSQPVRNSRAFALRVAGCVSSYKSDGDVVASSDPRFPRKVSHSIVRCPMRDQQLLVYELMRAHERRSAAKARNRGGDGSTAAASVYRSFTRMACNFVPSLLDPMTLRATLESRELRSQLASIKMSAYKRMDHVTDLRLGAPGSSLGACSSKLETMLRVMEATPDERPALVYTEYRTLEGERVIMDALSANGYAVREANNPPSPTTSLDKTKRNKTAMVFPDDDAQAARVTEAYNAGLIDVLLIRRTAAEGISLRGTRQVHVYEPYWHRVRVQQVVGRASRLGSHDHLPAAQRIFRVFEYHSVLPSPASERSTDEDIHAIAMRKHGVSKHFLRVMRSAAVDCGVHAELGDGVASAAGPTCELFGGGGGEGWEGSRAFPLDISMDPTLSQPMRFDYVRVSRHPSSPGDDGGDEARDEALLLVRYARDPVTGDVNANDIVAFSTTTGTDDGDDEPTEDSPVLMADGPAVVGDARAVGGGLDNPVLSGMTEVVISNVVRKRIAEALYRRNATTDGGGIINGETETE